jgi:hypothetical protein
VRPRILVAEVVDVAGRDRRQAALLGQLVGDVDLAAVLLAHVVDDAGRGLRYSSKRRS